MSSSTEIVDDTNINSSSIDDYNKTSHNSTNEKKKSFNRDSNIFCKILGFLNDTKNELSQLTFNLARGTYHSTASVYHSLNNPVVLINSIIGLSVVSTVLIGYIKNEKRFLLDKSNAYIWSSVLGTTAFITMDTFLSKKYFKKFE